MTAAGGRLLAPIVLVALAALALPGRSAGAQPSARARPAGLGADSTDSTASLAPGAVVRATAYVGNCHHPHTVTGTLLGLQGDTLSLVTTRRELEALPLTAVRRLEVATGGPSREAGARRGARLLGSVGLVAGALFLRPSGCETDGGCVVDPVGALLGGVGGLTLGAAGGWLLPAPSWRVVPRPPERPFRPICPAPVPVAFPR